MYERPQLCFLLLLPLVVAFRTISKRLPRFVYVVPPNDELISIAALAGDDSKSKLEIIDTATTK